MIEIERTRIHFLSDAFEAVVVAWAIGTLRPDNGDVYENVSEKKKKDFASFHLFSRLFQAAQLLKRRDFGLELKRGDCARVLTEMVEFIVLLFPFPRKLNIWSLAS